MTALSSFLLAPQFLWFLLLIPVVVALYLLKLRRTEAVISSTMLWMKSLKDLTANAPFQRLRRNLLLLLQLIILILAIGALSRPFLKVEGMTGSHYCLVIDHSASMQTKEGNKTRLDLAKEKAIDLIDSLDSGDKVMVVAFAENAEVKIEMSDDTQRLRAAIRDIKPTDTRSNIRDVMMIAASLAPDNPDLPATIPDLQLILLSDGRLTDLDEVGARARDVTYHKIGEETFNVGIIGVRLRKNETDGAPAQTLVSVFNAHDEEIETTLTLYLNDSVIGVEEVSLNPQSTSDVVFEHPDFAEGVILVELDEEDALVLDNRAWMAIAPATTKKVLLVTEPNSSNAYYLKRALALNSEVELSEISPAAYQTTEQFELTIFDSYVPEVLPPGSSVFFNELPKLDGLVTTGSLESPPILSVERNHPVMRYLNPENVGITRTTTFSVPQGSKTLLTTRGSPLIADVSRDGRQLLVVGFNISESDWPLKLSFPIFVQNVVKWVPTRGTSHQQFIQAGTPIELLPDIERMDVRIETPTGETHAIRVEPSHPAYFGATSNVGIYSIGTGEEEYSVAANLTHAEESNIHPSDTLAFGRGTIKATQKPVRSTRELWPWFVLAALIVLQLEWWVYSRRAWI